MATGAYDDLIALLETLQGHDFEMGLLEMSDWEGAWISAGKGPAGDLEPPSGDEYDDLANGLAPSPYLRREFPLDKPVSLARLYATARGVYELYINGNRVGNDVLAPGWTDYDRRVQYQTYDVTDLVREGGNDLEVLLGNGSDDLIQIVTLALAKPGAVMMYPGPTFVMYAMNATFFGLRAVAAGGGEA